MDIFFIGSLAMPRLSPEVFLCFLMEGVQFQCGGKILPGLPWSPGLKVYLSKVKIDAGQ